MLSDSVHRSIESANKSQRVRLYADLLFIAPFLGYIAYKGGATKSDRTILAIIAIVTIAYNWHNYRRLK